MNSALTHLGFVFRMPGLLSLVLTTVALTTSSSAADPKVISYPVGFTSITLAPGYNAVSVSLLNLDTLNGKVATPGGVAGNVVTTIDAGSNLGASLNATKQYYLEIMSDGAAQLSYTGERFEVDVAATIASANQNVTLKAPSPTNTMSPIPNLSDCSFVVREHVTIAQVFGGAGRVLLSGSGLASSSDQVLFYDNATGLFETYWFRSNVGGTVVSWRSIVGSDTTDYSNLPIRPGVGLFVYRQPSAGTVTINHAGRVRTNAFRQPLPAGFSLISPPAPLKHSPAGADMIQANGWVGSGSATSSDQVHFWNGSGFNTFWFRANVTGTIQEWRNTSDIDSANHMNDANFFPGGQSIFVRKLQPDPEYILNLVKP